MRDIVAPAFVDKVFCFDFSYEFGRSAVREEQDKSLSVVENLELVQKHLLDIISVRLDSVEVLRCIWFHFERRNPLTAVLDLNLSQLLVNQVQHLCQLFCDFDAFASRKSACPPDKENARFQGQSQRRTNELLGLSQADGAKLCDRMTLWEAHIVATEVCAQFNW